MYKHILVPLDGSPFGESALSYAKEIAKQFDARVTLLKVVATTHTYMAVDDPRLYEEIRLAGIGQAEAYLRAKQAELVAEGIDAHIHFIDMTNVANTILESIDDLKADLVAMSTHGRSGLDRWMFGSVAEKVVRHATVPVFLVRPKSEQ